MPEWTLSLNNRIIKRFTIANGGSVTIGRSPEADVFIDNTAISRQHATLELKAGQYFITDHYSLNGTMVNGQKIESTVPIADTDRLEIGKFVLAPAHEGDEAPATSSSAAPGMTDDTIIISSKDKAKPQPGPAKGQHRLLVLQGEASPAELYLEGKSNIKIGKDAASDIIITGALLPATLCFVVRRKESYFLVPQKSLIGSTSINGKKIKEETALRHGDVIEAGKVKIKFD